MKDDISDSHGLPSASINTRNVEDQDSWRLGVIVPIAAGAGATAPPAATATATVVHRGVLLPSNVPDPPDTATPLLLPTTTQRPRTESGLFQASKGKQGETPMVDDDHDRCCPVAKTTITPTPTTAAARDMVDPEANIPAVDTEESQGRTSVDDAEAVIPSAEPTTPASTTTPIWEAYLAPESGRRTTIEVVDAVVWDDTGIRRSDMRQWALLFAATLCVGAVIVLVAMSVLSWTRDENVVINDPPSSAPTTILSSTGRLGDILREIMTHFESPTLEQALTNPQSPQYRAALWMAEEDEHPATANLTYPLNQTSLDLLQFRQRYALATLYYATDGDEWADRCKFLSPTLHVCDWKCKVKVDPIRNNPAYENYYYRADLQMGALCHQSLYNGDPRPLDGLVSDLELRT